MHRPLLCLLLALHAALGAADVLAPRSAPAVASSGPEAEAALQAGRAALDRGDLAGAERLWRDALIRQEDSGLLYALGAFLFGQSRLADAEAVFQRLAQRAPELADAWYQLGLVRAARGRYRDAADAQRLAVGHAPRFGQAYCALALALRESGQTGEGLSAAAEALRLLPAYAGGWNLLGNLQQDAGKLNEALASYRQALQLEPRYPGAWFNLAALLDKAGRPAEARDAYARALQLRPGFAEARLARAELALEQKDLDAAEEDFDAATRLQGWQAEAYWGLVRVAKARGRMDEADLKLQSYRRSVRARDRALAREAEAGIERPMPFEPGLPLAQSAPAPAAALP